MSRLRSIKQFLTSKHISVPENWISNLCASDDVSERSVYQRWLNTDLRTIGLNQSNFPSDINVIKADNQQETINKVILNGRYAVQINSMRDISVPLVDSQVENLDNSQESEDEEGSENMFKKKKAKVSQKRVKKGSRVLHLSLCDGQMTVKAIEDKKIDCISADTKPGTKLLLKGPIEVYSAVLFLRPHNVEFLGGFVEEMNQQPMLVKKLKESSIPNSQQ